MSFRFRLLASSCLCGIACAPFLLNTETARAQSSAAAPDTTPLPPVVVEAQKPRLNVRKRRPAGPVSRTATAAPKPPQALLTVTPAAGSGIVAGVAPVKQKYQLAQTSEGITRQKIEQTINVVDTADAVKYLPSLFVRKRNEGDNQAVLATRTWGLSSSARTLIYADDILLSTLLGNNNSNASPRWGMVAPEEIERIDFLYGPFAAMYPGNSIGGVLQITTRTPDKPEFTFRQTEAFQTFDFYKTANTYRTDQTSATFGNRWGDLSVFVAANFQNSDSPPLSWITSGTGINNLPVGAIPQLSRTYTTANVIGAGGLLHTDQANVKGKFVLDVNDWLKATYTVGFFDNAQQSRVQTYLRDNVTGMPTYGGPANGAGFAGAYYNLSQQQLANAFALKTDTGGALDGELVVTRYDYLKDLQRNPFTAAATGTNFTDVGKITRLDGTNWTTVDAKGIWRTSFAGQHELSFGLHGDRYELVNPVYKTPTWNGGPDATSEFYSNSAGKTQAVGLWAQDAWRLAPQWKLTLGGRWEEWRAFDGFNLNTAANSVTGAINSTAAANQPTLQAARFSPKGSLSFEPSKEWQITTSVGVANRFPTVTELYQTSVAANQVFIPNPNLRPEDALDTELAIERKFVDGKVRLSLFQENTRDAIIAQNTSFTDAVTNQPITASIATNIDKIRARGAELAWQKDDVAVDHLELFGSVTYVDARILSDPAFVSTNAVGKRVPNVPEWRSTLGATYRPTEQWAFTAVGRYQSKTFSTLDNIDTNPNVFQAFDPFVVVDMKVQYKVSQNGTLNLGIDNVFNAQYHLFHPFPQRTFVLSGKFQL